MTVSDKVLDALEQGTTPKALVDIERAARQAVTQIDPRLKDSVRAEEAARIRDGATQSLHLMADKLAADADAEAARALRAIDQEEAAARAPADPNTEVRALRDEVVASSSMQLIGMTTDAATIATLAEEGFATNRPSVIKRLAPAALIRLEQLAAAAAHRGEQNSAARQAYGTLHARYSEWQRRDTAASPAGRRTQARNEAAAKKDRIRAGLTKLLQARQGY